MEKSECDAWFLTEVLPLEAALMRYLAGNVRNGSDVDDLRQEVYARVYGAALKRRPEITRAFVFVTARNLLIDRGRRERVVSFDLVGDIDAHETVDVGAVDREMSARLELRRVATAIAALPPRCRAVVVMRKIDDLPQREVARRLGITEDTVERQVSKGVRALAAAVFGDDDGRRERPHNDRKRHGRRSGL